MHLSVAATYICFEREFTLALKYIGNFQVVPHAYKI